MFANCRLTARSCAEIAAASRSATGRGSGSKWPNRSSPRGPAKKEKGKEVTDPASYEVGYGRPPRHSRFKSGLSGNPEGRPKGSKSLKTLLVEALSSSVTILEGGVPKKMELRQLLFKGLVGKAVKGDARSTAVLVKLMEKFGLSQPDEKEVIKTGTTGGALEVLS